MIVSGLEIAKASAILDQIPEPAAIYDSTGRLERMNAAAVREGSPALHHLDGTAMPEQELPWIAALRGEIGV